MVGHMASMQTQRLGWLPGVVCDSHAFKLVVQLGPGWSRDAGLVRHYPETCNELSLLVVHKGEKFRVN